jgi:hypothetical protein
MIATQDRMLNPDLERLMAKHAQSKTSNGRAAMQFFFRMRGKWHR